MLHLSARLVAPGVVLAVLLTACPSGERSNTVVATVGDRTITLEQYRDRYRRVQKDIGDIPVLDAESLRALRLRVLSEMIDETLLLIEAESRGVTVEKQDVEAEVERLRTSIGERDWRRFLLEHYVDERSWIASVRRNLTIDRLVDQAIRAAEPITEGELRSYYEAHQERFQRPREIRLRQIVVAEESTARELRKQLRQGAAFAELARERSLGPEAVRGGDLGYVRPSDLPVSFESAFRLRPGRVSEVIKTEYGYHLFKIDDVRTAHVQPFEETRDVIERMLTSQLRQEVKEALLQDLQTRIPVDINEEVWNSYVESR